MTYQCSGCEGYIYEDDEEGIVTIRTSGKAKIYCQRCGKRMTERFERSATPYIITPYMSVNAVNDGAVFS